MKYQLKNIWIVWDQHNYEDIVNKGIKERLIIKTKEQITTFFIKNSQIYLIKEKKK